MKPVDRAWNAAGIIIFGLIMADTIRDTDLWPRCKRRQDHHSGQPCPLCGRE